MKRVYFHILFLSISFASLAQSHDSESEEDSLLGVAKESIEVITADTSKQFMKTMAQVFGVKPYSNLEKPKIAFVRSLFVPGWGQITNGDKKDFAWAAGVYVAAIGGGYAIYFNNKKYKTYLSHYAKATFLTRGLVFYDDSSFESSNALATTAAYYLSDNNEHDNFYLRTSEDVNYTLKEVAGDGKTSPEIYYIATETTSEEVMIGPFNSSTFSSAKDQFRRQRGLSIIGIGAGWLFFALEANVSAHLKTFDMSEDISMNIGPAGPNTFGMMASGLKLSIAFN